MEPPAFQGTERFEVLDALGQGAMCVVYRVRDRRDDRIVALKTLRHADAAALYRLKQEFRALSQVDHPNVVQFYELLHTKEGWFVTMELVEGVDFLSWSRGEAEGLRSRQRSGSTWRSSTDLRFSHSAAVGPDAVPDPAPFAPESPGTLPDLMRLRSTLRQLADGTAAVHAAGRIHRDLKPSNVLVTDAGRVVVLDFGLVAEIDQDYTAGTLHQHIAGSAAYMSPEQAMGLPLAEASDWYGLGVMLYEALTGVWPYSGHVFEILSRKQDEDPPRPSDRVPGVPGDLDALCMDLLQRDPAKRPDGAEILARLRHRRPTGATPVLSPRFQHRRNELRFAWHLWRETCGTRRPTVLRVHGPPGVGRTRLLRELVKRVRGAGAATLKARCLPWESMSLHALDGVVDNLTRVLRRADHTLLRRLANEPLSHLAAQFPTFERVDALDVVPTQPADGEDLQSLAVAELGGVLALLAEHQPVLISIDDVHHADTDSVVALVDVVRQALQRPLMLVVSHPDGHPGPMGDETTGALEGLGITVREIALTTLTTWQSSHLAAEMLALPAEDPVVHDVAVASDGNLAQLARRVREVQIADGQRAEPIGELTGLTAQIIDGLTEAPRRLLEILAVAEAPLSCELAVAAASLIDSDRAITTLRAHQLVTTRGHGAIEICLGGGSDYVVDSMSEGDRQERHAALAGAMEAASDPPAGEAGVIDPRDPRTRTRHWLAAGQTDRAAAACWTGAQEAVAEGRWSDARWLLQQSLGHDGWTPRERAAILGHLGEALLFDGQPREARHRFLAAADALDPGRRQRLRLRAAEASITSGDVEGGLELLCTVLPHVGAPSVPRPWRRPVTAAWRHWWHGAAVSTAPTAHPRIRDATAAALRTDAVWVAAEGLRIVDPAQATAMHPVHLKAARTGGDPDRWIRAASAHARQLPAAEADPLLACLRVDAGTRPVQAHVLAAAAEVALRRGALSDAAEHARNAEAIWRRTGTGAAWQRHQVRAVALRARLWAGHPIEAHTQLSPRVRPCAEAGDRVGHVELVAGDLILAIATADGLEAAWRAVDRAGDGGPLPPRQRALVGIARAWLGSVLEPGRNNLREAGRIPMLADPWLSALRCRVTGHAALTAGRVRLARRAACHLADRSEPWAQGWAALLHGAIARGTESDPKPLQQARVRLQRLGFHLDVAAIDAVLGSADGPAVGLEAAEAVARIGSLILPTPG